MIRASRDVIAGLVLIALAAVHAFQAVKLDLGTPFQMGPGAFPLIVSALLGLVGAGVVAVGMQKPVAISGRFAIWPLFMVSLAVIVFAVAVRPLGLVPTLVITSFLAGMARRPVQWGRNAVVSVAIALACWAIFIWGIGLNVRAFGSLFEMS